MSIGVQSTNAALAALQTLGRLNDTAAAPDATANADATTSSTATPAVASTALQSSLDASGLGAASANLDLASSITDSALSAGASIGALLEQMKGLAGQVQDGSASGQAADGDFSKLLGQIGAAVSGAGFEGVNLLDGSAAPSVTVGSAAGGQVTLSATNLSLGSGVITLGPAASVSTPTAAAGALGDIDASSANVANVLAQIGDQATQLSAHASFVSRLSNVLSAGLGAAPPASADGARLMALQVQQQLTAAGSGIANAAPNVVLSLFQ